MMENKLENIREQLIAVSGELGVELISPYYIQEIDKTVFAFLPHAGSEKGMYLETTFPPDYELDEKLIDYSKRQGLFYSFMNVDLFYKCDKNILLEAFEDWKLEK